MRFSKNQETTLKDKKTAIKLIIKIYQLQELFTSISTT